MTVTYKLIKIEKNQPEQSVELTEDEIDAIFDAMGDYQDYGEEEFELADSIRNKLF
jgi:hypothetical protein